MGIESNRENKGETVLFVNIAKMSELFASSFCALPFCKKKKKKKKEGEREGVHSASA